MNIILKKIISNVTKLLSDNIEKMSDLSEYKNILFKSIGYENSIFSSNNQENVSNTPTVTDPIVEEEEPTYINFSILLILLLLIIYIFF